MENNNMKNIVVLKNLPSNLVEEAIVILKENKNAKKLEYADKSTFLDYNEYADKKDYIVKEAETVISNYITKLESEEQNKSKRIKKIREKIKLYGIIVSIILITALICLKV